MGNSILRTRERFSLAVALIGIAFFASGCAPMSERHLYDIALHAVTAEGVLPVGAEPAPMKETEFYIGKNAACVIVPSRLSDSRPEENVVHYTVWLKRIGTQWELDRLFPTPVYTNEPSAKNVNLNEEGMR